MTRAACTLLLAAAGAAVAGPGPVSAQEGLASQITQCAAIQSVSERLDCYDRVARVLAPGQSGGGLGADASVLPHPSQTRWRGLVVAPEVRCSQYDADDYRYPQSVELKIISSLGGVYGPYTGQWFSGRGDTDIEHIVARSEAHDSGLCAADDATRRRFATDILNLTLASPAVNRYEKSDKDAAQWLPSLNQCWFADRVVEVRRKYALTIDATEATSLESVLNGCASTSLVVTQATSAPSRVAPSPVPTTDALRQWDDNGNGRITCAEARRHGIAPVRRGHPAYRYMRDGDGDGVVCER